MLLDGIVVINKPKGCTSHDIVNKTKRILNAKVGHTGTLDPNATGVLPLLVGQGTKLSYYLMEHDKEYIVTLQLGIKTDTADEEGNIVEKKEVLSRVLLKENVDKVLKAFIGKQKQIPPMYSAVKINGKKLYEYARKNEKIELKPREIEIYKIQLLDISQENKQIVFKVKCSKGTYIRSLCEDIAEKLETVGYMKELKRTIVGNFHIEDAITIEELEANKENQEFMQKHFITIEDFFKNDNMNNRNSEKENYRIQIGNENNKIQLDSQKLRLFFNGGQLTYRLKDGLYRIYDKEQQFIGIGLVKNNLLKREIIVENKSVM